MTPSNKFPRYSTTDEQPVTLIRRDFSGGVNTRHHGSEIKENQATALYNIDIGTMGQASKRPGSTLIADDVGSNSILGLHNFVITGETDYLLAYERTKMFSWNGAASTWTDLMTTFSAATEVGMISAKEAGLTPDDIVIMQNGIDNAFRIDADFNVADLGSTAGTGSDSPPKSTVMGWYGNRVWVLVNDLLYFSSAYPGDYSTAFDTVSNVFRVPVGEERGIIPTRDTGMVIMGEDAIWGIAPSVIPDPATDKPQPLITNRGCVSKHGWVNSGDEIYFFSQDGFRGLRRTEQDKLQTGTDLPLSYLLKDEFDKIDFNYIERLSMEYFDNKIFIAVPTGANTFDTWVYYPASQGFMVIQGWSPRCWSRYKVSGKEYLYYGKHGDGTTYRAWYGYSDEGTTTTNGTAITYQEEGRKEDLDQPLVKKSGGVLKIKAQSSGAYTLMIYASVDDGPYSLLGSADLQSNAPTLPVNLPFDLAPPNLVINEFHLESLGEWYQIRIKVYHSALNGTDDITVLERSIITYPVAFMDEDL